MATTKIAGVQMDIAIGAPAENLVSMRSRLEQSLAVGAQLTVFPECTTTGYCFESLAEAMAVAEPLDGRSVNTVAGWCRELSTCVIFGFLESADQLLYNSLALVGPEWFDRELSKSPFANAWRGSIYDARCRL